MMFETLTRLELPLLLALNGSDSVYLDGVFWAITKTFTWLPLYAALCYIILRNKGLKQSLLIFLSVALLVLVADQVASGLCKPFFCRFRPSRDPVVGPLIDVVNGYRGGKYGFFSSHASNTFAVATFLSFLFRSRVTTFLLYFWAVLSTWSRLYLGVHYPSDVFVGFLFGVCCGILFHRIYLALSHRLFATHAEGHTASHTPSGFLLSDFRVLYVALLLTCAYILIIAFWHASSF